MMKKQILFLFIFSIFLSSCLPDPTDKPTTPITKETVENVIPPFEVEFPDGYKILTQASGDLTKDGVDEKVLVLNTGEMGEMGEERVILIFKVEKGGWKMIHRASGAILPSEHGGMMGDPLESVSVEKGAIVIKHYGGSRTKWDNTHRFRFQNNKWELIGATLVTEDPCLEREKFDYNLSSGRVVYNHVKLICDNGEDSRVRSILSKAGFVSKMKTLPQMNSFVHGKIYAINPRTGTCIPQNNCYGVEVDEPTTTIDEGGITNEETTEPPISTPVPTISNQLNLKELVGIYTASGNDKSWILTIFPKGSAMEVSYYKVNGLLDDLELIIEGYTPQIIKGFELDTDNNIQSDLGKGIYRATGHGATITLFDFKDNNGNELVLTRDEDYGF